MSIDPILPNDLMNKIKKLSPPSIIHVEEIILANIIVTGEDALIKVIDLIRTPEVFYKKEHRIIWQNIIKLYNNSTHIDLVTLADAILKDKENNKGLVKVSYLSSLASKFLTSSLSSLENYANMLVEKFMARELIKISSKSLVSAYDEGADIPRIIEETERKILKISDVKPDKDALKLGDNIYNVLNKIESLISKSNDNNISGIPTYFHELDAYTGGWQNSDLIIISARPAMGKSALMLNMALNIAKYSKIPVLIFSLEMSLFQLTQRFIAIEAGISLNKLRNGNLNEYQISLLHKAIKDLENYPIFINDTEGLDIQDIRTKARRMKMEHGIGIIFIDYLQLIRTGSYRNHKTIRNREQEIAYISRSLKEIAKELSLPVISLAQLSRQVENRPDKKPMLSDLRESGAIEQDADIVTFLYRPEYYDFKMDEEGNTTENVAYIIIGKHRNGPTGEVKIGFKKYLAKFMNFEELNNKEKLQENNIDKKTYYNKKSGELEYLSVEFNDIEYQGYNNSPIDEDIDEGDEPNKELMNDVDDEDDEIPF